MPWCPVCGSEYREGFTQCTECKVDLVESLEGIIINEDNRQDTVKVEKPISIFDYRTRNTIEFLKYVYKCIKS